MSAQRSARHSDAGMGGQPYQLSLFDLLSNDTSTEGDNPRVVFDEVPPETARWIAEMYLWLYDNVDAALWVTEQVMDTARAGGHVSIATLCGRLCNEPDFKDEHGGPIRVNHNIVPAFARLVVALWPDLAEVIELRTSRFDDIDLLDDKWLEYTEEYQLDAGGAE